MARISECGLNNLRNLHMKHYSKGQSTSLVRLLHSDDPPEVDALWRLDYRTGPPPIERFIEDDYYLGAALRRTATNEGLWPQWRDWLVEQASLESFLHNLVISG